MVIKYPSTVEDLKFRREHIPKQEELFFTMVDALNDSWYVWHSVNWDNDAKKKSGEADFLLFHPEYGYVVLEVKGGIISVNNGIYFSLNRSTLERNRIKDPGDQARKSMHHIREFYENKAKNSKNVRKLLKRGKFFPLSFTYGVFFPDCRFKDDFEYMPLEFDRIFDEVDCKEQKEWMAGDKTVKSPLEKFLINLLDAYKRRRVILPETSDFFLKIMGSNISKYISMKKYLDTREIELKEINKVQDFLLNSLSKKLRCIFRGSAGSGKTFIAMKKALLNYNQGIKTLFLCFNAELRESVQEYLSKQLDKPIEEIQENLQVHTINSFLRLQINETFHGPSRNLLMDSLNNFKYESIAESLKKSKQKIYKEFKFDSILVDEAQDIAICLWDMFDYFLRDPKESILYIFYDEAQAIFVKEFSVEKFRMDAKKDLIVLTKNLRNTIEIAKWLENKTKLGEYQEYSDISGFKITTRSFPNSYEAFKRAINVVKKSFYDKNIDLSRIAVLSYYKLKTLIPRTMHNEYCDYLPLIDKKGASEEKFFIVEPKYISDFPTIMECKEIKNKSLILFKTISAFKGLERDVIFLIVPNFEEFKDRYLEKYQNFIMQIYVGASRAKFKLYVCEYSF